MKKVIFVFIFLMSLAVASFAQIKKKVKVSRKQGIQNIMVNKVIWGTAETYGHLLSYELTTEIKDLKGVKIASAKFNTQTPAEEEIPYIVLTFTNSQRVVYKKTNSFYFGDEIANFLVDNDALTIEGLNKAGEDKMVALYSTRPPK